VPQKRSGGYKKLSLDPWREGVLQPSIKLRGRRSIGCAGPSHRIPGTGAHLPPPRGVMPEAIRLKSSARPRRLEISTARSVAPWPERQQGLKRRSTCCTATGIRVFCNPGALPASDKERGVEILRGQAAGAGGCEAAAAESSARRARWGVIRSEKIRTYQRQSDKTALHRPPSAPPIFQPGRPVLAGQLVS